jgi:hypothetical protein
VTRWAAHGTAGAPRWGSLGRSRARRSAHLGTCAASPQNLQRRSLGGRAPMRQDP